jgi:hypothetical protein
MHGRPHEVAARFAPCGSPRNLIANRNRNLRGERRDAVVAESRMRGAEAKPAAPPGHGAVALGARSQFLHTQLVPLIRGARS